MAAALVCLVLLAPLLIAQSDAAGASPISDSGSESSGSEASESSDAGASESSESPSSPSETSDTTSTDESSPSPEASQEAGESDTATDGAEDITDEGSTEPPADEPTEGDTNATPPEDDTDTAPDEPPVDSETPPEDTEEPADDEPEDTPQDPPEEPDPTEPEPDDIPEPPADTCVSMSCDDSDPCTLDSCSDSACKHAAIPSCGLENTTQTIPQPKIPGSVMEITPELMKYILLNQYPGTRFGIQTKQPEYASGEDVWMTISAPAEADVELYFSYNGFDHYIKIPREKGYPLDFPLPIPETLDEGSYTIRAAIFYSGIILKSDTSFTVSEHASSARDEEETLPSEDPSDPAVGHIQSNVVEQTPPLESETVSEEDTTEEGQAADHPAEIPVESPPQDTLSGSALTHDPIVIGQPVEWQKTVKIENTESSPLDVEVQVAIPESAELIGVQEKQTEEIVQSETDGADVIIVDTLDEGEEKEYVVTFETDPAQKIESKPIVTDESWEKEIVISSNPEYEGAFQYTNVLSYATVKESASENIQLYWRVNGEEVDVTHYETFNVTFYDTNHNGLVDQISWITPHLSSQEFVIVVTLTATSSPFEHEISIIPTSPAPNSHFKDSPIPFGFTVNYNASYTKVLCNLTVDSALKFESIPAATNQTTALLTLDEGIHNWQVACAGEGTPSALTAPQSFVVDVSPPAIELHNPDPELSLRDSVTLNYTATDVYAASLTCSLYLNDVLNMTGLVAPSGTLQQISLSELENGTYTWNVGCADKAGNQNVTASKLFYIDTKRNFSIITNKLSYALGEGGVYWVTAPLGSKVTLIITTPLKTTITRFFEGPYPTLDTINFNDYGGQYILDGFLNFNGAIKQTTTTYSVTSSISAAITVDKETIEKGGSVAFTGAHGGGLGDVTYNWDFDDGTSATEKTVSHTFPDLKNYVVKLTVKDGKGNTATASVTITVKEKFPVKIQVRDGDTDNAIQNAKVNVGVDEVKTDGNGDAAYTLFVGEYEFLIRADGYDVFYGTILVNQETTYTAVLTKDVAEPFEEEKSEEPQNTEEGTPPVIEFEDSELEDVLLTALESIDSYSSDQRKLADTLRVREGLERAKENVARINRDLFNLKQNRAGLDQEAYNDRVADLEESLDELRKKTIMAVTAESPEEFAKYASPEQIEDIAQRYIKEKAHIKDTKSYLSSLDEIQNLVTISTVVQSGRITTLDGALSDITLVKHVASTFGDVQHTELVIDIPKTIAEDAKDITFLTPYTVVQSDPLIAFDLTEATDIMYYTRTTIDPDEAKNIALALLPTQTVDGKGASITGLAIFSKITSIDNPLVAFEVTIIVILLLAYVLYEFDLMQGVQRALIMRSQEIKAIYDIIHDIHVAIANNELDNAMLTYQDLMEAYKKLPAAKKPKVIQETKATYHKIIHAKVQEGLHAALALVQENHVNEAREKYEEIQTWYKELPPELRATVKERCTLLFERLNQA